MILNLFVISLIAENIEPLSKLPEHKVRFCDNSLTMMNELTASREARKRDDRKHVRDLNSSNVYRLHVRNEDLFLLLLRLLSLANEQFY